MAAPLLLPALACAVEPSSGEGSAELATIGKRPVPSLVALTERCKLINQRNMDDETANRTHSRANLRGTDLGIPVAHGADLYLFFGDSVGVRGIWPFGPTSHPDAVGSVAAGAVDDAGRACTDLRFLVLDREGSLGWRRDSSIERDFAGASMTAPPGHSIGEFVRNPSGTAWLFSTHASLPGDFEVPTGAFSYGDSIYLFYSYVESPSVAEMKGSYLARWQGPSPKGLPNYQILYEVDRRLDQAGALRGDFINVAPLVEGSWLYLFGTGAYRKSDVHLARKPLARLGESGGFERYDSSKNAWVAGNTQGVPPIARSGAMGELSVRYFANIDRYVMMDQELRPGDNQIVIRVADKITGPFSESITVASMNDAAFRGKYCCVNGDCLGERLFHCDRAGFYGTYMFPRATSREDGSFSLDFTMSTWDPYNVALMSATFR